MRKINFIMGIFVVAIFAAFICIRSQPVKKELNNDNLICKIVLRNGNKYPVMYDIYNDWTVNVVLPAFSGDDIKSERFILGKYDERLGIIKEESREKISNLIDELYKMEENTDYGYTVDGISDIKILVKEKAYWSPTIDVLASKHNEKYDEVIQELAKIVIEVSPDTKGMKKDIIKLEEE